jgi:ABC-2 type transport system permease protein
VDRLIALVALRWRLDLRAVMGARERAIGLLLAVPGLVFVSAAASFLAGSGVRVLERAQPGLVLPLLSAVATGIGVLWALSPLLAGMALTESHDLTRLLHYPVKLPTLVASSLVANVLQPTVLATLPPLLALGLALAGGGARLAPALLGLGLALALVVASGQAVGLMLHALSRNRRLNDRALFAGIGLGVLLSFLPLLVMSGGGAPLGRIARPLLARDVFALSPFAWGVRGAVHAGRGEAAAFLEWTGLALLALGAALALSAALAQRVYRGELDLGAAGPATAEGRGGLRLPGRVGAVLEKDLRMVWRDPRLKAVVLGGLLGPLVLLVLLSRNAQGQPALLLLLASFVGLSTVGANAFALERHGLALLFSFPVDRFLLLVAKNLTAVLVRLPGGAMVAVAAAVLVGPVLVPAVVALLLLTQVLALAVDNYVAILFPLPVPGAGRSPGAPTSGAAGLGAVAVAAAGSVVTLVLSSPFAFLAWLPLLMRRPLLWLLTLPLALAGAAAVYGMLTAGAATLLARREPELLARVRAEE